MSATKQHIVELDSEATVADLVALAEAGGEVVITRDAKPVARMVATPIPQASGPRVPGRLKGKFELDDTFFFAPLPEEELIAWEGALTDAAGISLPKSSGG